MTQGWHRRDQHRFGIGWTEAIEAYERRRPGRPASLESDVVVPVLQSAFTALLAGLAGLALAMGAGWAKPGLWALLGALLALVLAWGLLLRQHRALLWEVENVTGLDVDRDGTVGVPHVEPEPRTARVEIVEEGGRVIRYVDVPLSDRELARLADVVLRQGVRFSRRRLADAGAIDEEKYGELTDALLEGGLLRYRGDGARSGVELSPSGRAFLRQYLG